jgi:hypothetical protein
MISSFDSVEAVYVGKFQHVCASVTITTKLIYLVITKTHNSDYVILIMKMLIHTLHEGTVLGQDMKSTFECFHILKKSWKVPKG